MMSKLSQVANGIVAAGQIAKQVTAIPGQLAGGAIGAAVGFGRGCVQITGSKILNKLQSKWHFEPKSLKEYTLSAAKTGSKLGGTVSNVAVVIGAPHVLGPAGYVVSGLVYIGMLKEVLSNRNEKAQQMQQGFPRYQHSPEPRSLSDLCFRA